MFFAFLENRNLIHSNLLKRARTNFILCHWKKVKDRMCLWQENIKKSTTVLLLLKYPGQFVTNRFRSVIASSSTFSYKHTSPLLLFPLTIFSQATFFCVSLPGVHTLMTPFQAASPAAACHAHVSRRKIEHVFLYIISCLLLLQYIIFCSTICLPSEELLVKLLPYFR